MMMNSSVKLVLGLAVLVGAVFGLTVISQFSGEEPQNNNANGSGQTTAIIEPLIYNLTHVYYDPTSTIPARKEFPGFFEVGDTVHYVSFVIQNPHTVPVRVTAKGRSCTACTNARIAVFPKELAPNFVGSLAKDTEPDDIEKLTEDYLYEQIPSLESKFDWQALNFEDQNQFVEIPASPSAEQPVWGVLQLGIVVKAAIPKKIVALLSLQTQDMKLPLDTEFSVSYIGTSPFEVYPKQIDFGTIPEGAEPRTVELLFYSSTRSQNDLPAPVYATADKDPFLVTSKPTPLTAEECANLAKQLSGNQGAMRVTAGYKFQVTLNRTVKTETGVRDMDIGEADRVLSVTSSGSGISDTSIRVLIKSNATGIIELAGGNTLELGDFDGKVGTQKNFTLRSDRTEMELEWLKEETSSVYQVELEMPAVEGNRKRWNGIVKVAPFAITGPTPLNSVIVFRVKSTGQLIRIPVKGSGFKR